MDRVKYQTGKNYVEQECSTSDGEILDVKTIVASWKNSISFIEQENSTPGFRPAQLGALYSIKAHWIVSKEPATIVMPTGTGKTETMIATVVSEMINRTLIVVPSNLLRKQTAEKFITFGILQDIKIINNSAIKPAVTTLTKTPMDLKELQEILKMSNVIVTTMALLQRFSNEYILAISDSCDTLIVDEAVILGLN